MNLKNCKKIYFLGIGGIGMSALARYFKLLGKEVAGYDKTETDLTKSLVKEGIPVYYQEEIGHISSNTDLVVYTPAIPKDHQELLYVQQREIPLKKRAEVLGIISKNYQSVAVAGTHGKTTTSSIIAHIMYSSNIGCNAFVGGIMNNYNTNVLLHEHSDWVVLEADEYDRSFMHLHPKICIINSIDADHLDIYGSHDEVKNSYVRFSHQLQQNGTLICHHAIKNTFPHAQYTFSVENPKADIFASQIQKGYYGTKATIHIQALHEQMQIEAPIFGNHNLENVLAAILATRLAGVTTQQITHSLQQFKGIKRRFEIAYKSQTSIVIDDYAHHPTELNSVIHTVREYFPNQALTIVFQPHLFSRTRDFYDDFAVSLSLADHVLLLDIYPAREKPIEGVSSEILLSKIHNPSKKLIQKHELYDAVKNNLPGVILMAGAGDIDVLVHTLIKQIQHNEPK